jgi:hypothetical protein
VIVRHLPEGELYDQEALAVENGVSVRTVRRKCEAVACDVASRAPLYDPDAAGHTLGKVKPRPARTAAVQMMRRLSAA